MQSGYKWPTKEEQNRAVREANEFFESTGGFSTLKQQTDTLLAADINQPVPERVARLLPAFEYLTLVWVPNNLRAVRFVRNGGTSSGDAKPLSQELRDWVYLEERVKQAVARNRQF